MILDIFDDDAFGVHNLSAGIDLLPYVPGRIGKMNLFTPKPITTDVAVFEQRFGQIQLLMSAKRGSQGQNTQSDPQRKVRAVKVPHTPHWDALLAADISGVRAFGTEDQTETFSTLLNDKFESMKQDHEVTFEFQRAGALKGVVLDGDGSTELVNWFDVFEITENIAYFYSYDAGTLDQADPVMSVKTYAQSVIRTIRDAMGQTAFTGVHALCGDNFFDAIIEHATTKRAFERYQDGVALRDTQIAEGQVFPFAGINWENYRGRIGDVDFVNTNECRFFPTGTRDLFQQIIAPADFIETVNTKGIPIYAKQERMEFDKGLKLHTQANNLFACTRPGVLVRGILYTGVTGTGS